MKLHGNAALSLNSRRRLVAMVLEQGRSRIGDVVGVRLGKQHRSERLRRQTCLVLHMRMSAPMLRTLQGAVCEARPS